MVAVAVAAGPTHVGINAVLHLTIGLAMPPVRVCFRVAVDIAKVSLGAARSVGIRRIRVLSFVSHIACILILRPGLYFK